MFEEAPLVIRSLVKTQFAETFRFCSGPRSPPSLRVAFAPLRLVFLLPSHYIQRKSEMGQLALTRLSKIALSGDNDTFRYAQGFLVPQPTGRNYVTRKILRR